MHPFRDRPTNFAAPNTKHQKVSVIDVRGYGSRPGLWVALATALAMVAAVVLVTIGLRSSRHSLSTRFDTRSQLAGRFAAEYMRQVEEREQKVAVARMTGAIDGDAFGQAVTDQGFIAAVLLDSNSHLLQVFPPDPKMLGANFRGRYHHLDEAEQGHASVSRPRCACSRRDRPRCTASVIEVCSPSESAPISM